MKDLEQENYELHNEVTILRTGIEKLTALVESLMAAHNQPSTLVTEAQAQNIMVSDIVTTPASVAQVSHPQHQIPKGFPWGIPYNFTLEGYHPTV